MNGKQFNIMILLAAVSLAALIIVGGCKKSEPEGPSDTMSDVKDVAAAAGEQTMCPIMDAPINKDIFIEYKGKKVYFCCQGCEDKFNENPEKYLAKLPQFN